MIRQINTTWGAKVGPEVSSHWWFSCEAPESRVAPMALAFQPKIADREELGPGAQSSETSECWEMLAFWRLSDVLPRLCFKEWCRGHKPLNVRQD